MRKILPTLKDSFTRAVKASPFVRGVIRHSGKVSGLSYMAGNVILMAKDSINAGTPELTPNVLAAVCFLGSDVSFAMSDSRPWTRRISGVCIMTAGSLILYEGMKDPRGLLGLVAGTGMIIISGAQILAENKMIHISRKLNEKQHTGIKGVFARAAQKYTAHPLLVTGVPNMLMKPGLITAAVMRGDFLFAATGTLWMVGDVGMAATDRLFKRMLRKAERGTENTDTPPPHLPPPALP